MTYKSRRKTVALLGSFLFCGLLLALPVAAHAGAFQIVPECALVKTKEEIPDLNCVLQTFDNIAKLILGVTGSFALLMFVYGGFIMLTSAGSQEKVSKGKTILTNAVIGIVIIMTAGYLIDYGVKKVTGGTAQLAGSSCSSGDNTGVMVDLPSGLTCVTSCSQISGYQCQDVASLQNKECVSGICRGGGCECCKVEGGGAKACQRQQGQ
ncbi:hypothetical protein AMJ57_05350 [Parcubacteria bacterium SG8_24]|nr:MAG: hypothetical protein AMJ57_05350 [Parcubacteria bacterium SG8_24]